MEGKEGSRKGTAGDGFPRMAFASDVAFRRLTSRRATTHERICHGRAQSIGRTKAVPFRFPLQVGHQLTLLCLGVDPPTGDAACLWCLTRRPRYW